MKRTVHILSFYFLILTSILPNSYSQKKNIIYSSIQSTIFLNRDGTYTERSTSSLGYAEYPRRKFLSHGTYIERKEGYYLTSAPDIDPDSIRVFPIESCILGYDSLIVEINSPSEITSREIQRRSQFYRIKILCQNDSISKNYELILNNQAEKAIKKNKLVLYKPENIQIIAIEIEIIPYSTPSIPPYFPYIAHSRSITYQYQLKDSSANYIHIYFCDVDFYYFTYLRYNMQPAIKINRNSFYFRNRTYFKSTVREKKMKNKKEL